MDGERCMDAYLTPPDSRQIALGNHLILSSIFKFVKAKELKSFRQVSRLWCDIATHLLKKNRSLKCRRHYETDLNVFKSVVSSSTFPALIWEWDFGDICDQNYDSKAKSIASFLERWNTITEGAGGNEQAWDSSGVAIAISSTYWRSCDRNTSRVIELVKQILTGVKNIVTLTLNLDLESYHKSILLWRLDSQFQLPRLESINFILDSNRESETSTRQNLVHSILDAAPNLKQVKGAKYHIWAMLLDTNKAHNLKALQVDLKGLYEFYRRDDLNLNDLLKELMEAVPVMESFELPDHVLSQYFRKLHNPLRELWVPSRILIHYSKTLRTITTTQLSFLDVCESHEEPELPVFQNLAFLELKNSWVVPLLPYRSSSTFMFPHLHHVKLDLKGCSGENMRVYFGKDDEQDSGLVTMPLVRKLELSCRYDKKGMQILAQVFPNVIEITLYQEIGKYVHSLHNGIWHMPQSVETLTLHYLAVNFRRTKLRNLDEIFTGISNRMLKTLPRKVAAKPQLTIAARNGIRKLKGLKSLRIIFDVDEVAVHRSLLEKNERLSKEEILESLETPFFLEKDAFTALSRLYAFEPAAFTTCICYDSHVHCASQIRKFLEPLLSPCVFLDHYYVSEKSEGLKVTLTTEAMDNEVYPMDLITSWFDQSDGAGIASANLMEAS